MKKILIIIVFLMIFCLLNKLVMPKYMTNLKEGNMTYEYYKEDKNHEVIFLGDCEVYANISPLTMYENYGITSYVRGNSQQLIWQSYYLLKETLKYEIPKVVVFNVNSLRYDKKVSEAYNHLMIDKMKWSKEKIDLIKVSLLENENFLYYVFPILRYHDRIFSLTKEDITYLFKEKNNTYNGFLVNKKVKPVSNLPTKRKLSTYKFQDNVLKYLDKIRILCKKNNIKLVLMKAPSLYPYWYQEYEKQVRDYASKYNLDYYNFTISTNDIGINYKEDTYDGGLHLNLNGAIKLSNYFGKILKEKYFLKDYRKDDKISSIYNLKLKEFKKEVE